MEYEYQLRHPFVMTCAGPTQYGKITLINELILRKDQVIFPNIQRVIFCYNEDEPPFAQDLIKKLGDRIHFQKGFGVDVEEGNSIPTLVILDDLMEEAFQSKEVCAMVTRGSSQSKYEYCHHSAEFFLQKLLNVDVTVNTLSYFGIRGIRASSTF
jgi:hypothetical protein